MAKAGQRGSCGMGQPPRGGDQLFQPGALLALELGISITRAIFVLWRGAVAVGAAVALRAAAIFAAFVFCGTAVLGMDCEPRSSAAMAFSPASVNFNEYAWPVSSSRRQASIPVFALISREAGLQKLGRDLSAPRRLSRVFGGIGSDPCVVTPGTESTLCVGEFGGGLRDHPLGFGGAVAVTTASPEPADKPGGAEEFADHFIGGSLLRRLSALEHVTTIAVERDESE